MQYLNRQMFTNFQDYSNHSLQLTLQRKRRIATTRLISHFLDELCKPEVQGTAVQVFKTLHAVDMIIFGRTPRLK